MSSLAPVDQDSIIDNKSVLVANVEWYGGRQVYNREGNRDKLDDGGACHHLAHSPSR
jgi:hypothetical protein